MMFVYQARPVTLNHCDQMLEWKVAQIFQKLPKNYLQQVLL